jgi:hypothetical protein
MNTKYFVIVAAMTAMLIGTTALTTTDVAFAGGYKSHATSQANACGNDKLPLNVFCSNSASQVQGDENAVAADSSQQAGEEHEDGGYGEKDGKKDGGYGKDW